MDNLNYIKNEMLAHVPLCTHAAPRHVLIIGGDGALRTEAERYSEIEEIIAIQSEEALHDLDGFREGYFDVAIIAEGHFATDPLFWDLLSKALNSTGVLATVASTLLTQPEQAEMELQALGEHFWIVMPYRYEAREADGHLVEKNAYLASKKYHPTADINLQRADLTEGYRYYNSDIAVAAFAMPTVIRKRFAGLIRN